MSPLSAWATSPLYKKYVSAGVDCSGAATGAEALPRTRKKMNIKEKMKKLTNENEKKYLVNFNQYFDMVN